MRKWLLTLTVTLSLLLTNLGQVQAAPAAQYFPATGHWVQGDFLSFFDGHGGLDMFGYPRTEQFVSNGRLVQYFQRARFESWPENPPPYNVQLMLIGDAVMGPGDPPIPASQIPSPNDRTHTYFPQTGHTLSGAFRDYFNKHGGLTLFGYPTSEPYVGPSGLLMQRFQRARFEFHPELDPPYQVSLGLLGDEYIFKMDKVPVELTLPAPANAPLTSATGSRGTIVYETSPGGNLIVASADGSSPTVVGQGMDPAWSPDGSKIAYASWGTDPGIYVINADGSQARRVWTGQDSRAPVWSPDGQRIAFYRRFDGAVNIDGHNYKTDFFQVLVLNLSDGSTWLPPNQPSHSTSPSWSPNGQTLVFAGNDALYLAGVGRATQPIPNTNQSFTTPAWSPDGSQIAFTYWNHDHWDVGVVNPDGSGMRVLTYNSTFPAAASSNAGAAWSPNGQQIIFISNRTKAWNLYIMSRDGSNVTPAVTQPLEYTGAYERIVSWKKGTP